MPQAFSITQTAIDQGYAASLMGLFEAKTEAEGTPLIKCPVCKLERADTMDKVAILRHGVCVVCLRKGAS